MTLETIRSGSRVAVRLAAAGAASVAGVAVVAAACALAAPRTTRPGGVADSPAARQAELVTVPGGTTRIGDDMSAADERPAFAWRSHPLLMDRTPVTTAQFAAFVRATRYRTDAERLGSGTVLDKAQGAWVAKRGADWRRPSGPTGPAAGPDHPVVQVSWRDADAFCRAYGARLPTELEWERAARLGQTPDGHVFKAGDPVRDGPRALINVWNGFFPFVDEGANGYHGTSPVGAFGAAPSGLTDMAGNVWEWTASWYASYGAPDRPPPGGDAERVQRGGSFLCDPGFCQGFRATARGHATPDSSFVHVGFRCVVDPNRMTARAGRIVGVAQARAQAPGPVLKPTKKTA